MTVVIAILLLINIRVCWLIAYNLKQIGIGMVNMHDQSMRNTRAVKDLLAKNLKG